MQQVHISLVRLLWWLSTVDWGKEIQASGVGGLELGRGIGTGEKRHTEFEAAAVYASALNIRYENEC